MTQPPATDYPDTIPCICCGKPLKDWSGGNNQPIGGLEFATWGHYPSSLFDNGSGELVVNVCDNCLLAGARADRVLKRTYPEPRHRGDRAIFKLWEGRRTEQSQHGDDTTVRRSSGNLLRDIGYAHPDEMVIKFSLQNTIALRLEDFAVERAAAATGERADRIRQVAYGGVQDISAGDLRRILAALEAEWGR